MPLKLARFLDRQKEKVMVEKVMDVSQAEIESILPFFEYSHLPERLQATSKPFHDLAHEMATNGPCTEVAAGLRKLLEAKDCFVRARVRRLP